MASLNNYMCVIVNGWKIETWEAECRDCGFVGGLARITRPDGSGVLWSGASCYETPRRSPAVVAERIRKMLDAETKPL